MKSKSLKKRITVLTATPGTPNLFPLLVSAAAHIEQNQLKRPLRRNF